MTNQELAQVLRLQRENDALKIELADWKARALKAEQAGESRIVECASRLVQHADFQLGGILSADSKAKDIPSKAVSQVKSRHLAALRDALSTTPPQPAAQEPVAWINSSTLISFSIDRERYPGGHGDQSTTRGYRTDYHNTPLYATPPTTGTALGQLVEALGLWMSLSNADAAKEFSTDVDGCQMQSLDQYATYYERLTAAKGASRAAIAAGKTFIKESGK